MHVQGVCKVFKGPEFVKKHLWNKHAPRVMDELYAMAYLTDPNRPCDAGPVPPPTPHPRPPHARSPSHHFMCLSGASAVPGKDYCG